MTHQKTQAFVLRFLCSTVVADVVKDPIAARHSLEIARGLLSCKKTGFF
jgi:hypothetical protein